jgi:hypothetical protein
MRDFIVFTPHECDQTKEEMDGTRNIYEGKRMTTGFWSVKLKKKNTWKI